MTLQEKIKLAEEEVDQATRMIEYSRKETGKWERTLELRTETVAALKEQAKPAKRKDTKQ